MFFTVLVVFLFVVIHVWFGCLKAFFVLCSLQDKELGGSGKPAPSVLAFVPRWVGAPSLFFFQTYFLQLGDGTRGPWPLWVGAPQA